MIIPKFWAEGRIQKRFTDRQITVRRFGWSSASSEDAQNLADERTKDAFDKIVVGEKLPRYEHKVPYNGADGLPIREEILSEHAPHIITRNSYGAHCLNTPNVLIGDVDFYDDGVDSSSCFVSICSVIFGIIYGLYSSSWMNFWLVATIGSVVLSVFSKASKSFYVRCKGGAKNIAIKRITRFIESHPAWNLNLYQTPAGIRVIALHDLFEADADETQHFFREIKADSMYVRMCELQKCFRARLTAKPWRIGIAAHMKPRPGIWPINPERLPARLKWVESYEQKASQYASCHFIKSIGSNTVHPDVQVLVELHDRESKCHTHLPIA